MSTMAQECDVNHAQAVGVRIPEIATIHVCGHWTVTVPASGNAAKQIVRIDAEFADYEANGIFVYNHVFSSTPCPEAKCQAIRSEDFERIDDEWALDWQDSLSCELPHHDSRIKAANFLATCIRTWMIVEDFSLDAQQLLAECLHKHDSFLANVIARRDLNQGPAALAKNVLRAATWLDRAANWWDEGCKAFYTACLVMAENHLNHQQFALEGFSVALEETQACLCQRATGGLNGWFDDNSDSDSGLNLLIPDDFCESDIHRINLTEFFHLSLNMQQADGDAGDAGDATYAPSSIGECASEYGNEDAVSEHPVTVDEVVNLLHDQDTYGPAYTPWIGRLEEVQLSPAVEHLVLEYLAEHDPCGNQATFDDVCAFHENDISADVDHANTLEKASSLPKQCKEEGCFEIELVEPEPAFDAHWHYVSSTVEPLQNKIGTGFAHIFGNGSLDDFEFHPSELP